MRNVWTCCCLLLLFSSVAIAQEGHSQVLRVELSNCVTLSVDPENEDSLSVAVPQTTTRTETRKVPVQRFRNEVRTRTALVNGVQQQQTYTVNVPITETVEQTFSVSLPGKPKAISIPLDEMDAWDRSGASIDPDRLKSMLSGSIPAIVLNQRWRKPATIPPVQLAVLRDDIVFIYAEKLKPNHSKSVP